DSVTVCPVDTADSPAGSGTFASRGAIAEVGAIRSAAAILRDKLTAIAACLLEVSADDLELHEGHVGVRGVPDRSVSFAEIARVAYAPGALPAGVEPGLEASAPFD